MQKTVFAEEISKLEQNQHISRKSKLLSLSVFLDEERLLRVGGRLVHSKDNYSRKHQIVLPNKHKLTDMIIRDYRFQQLHPGPQATLAAIRSQYWIIRGRSYVRRIINKCIICFKAKPTSVTCKMGDLPSSRVQQARPFLNCGVDYCGPFQLKQSLVRNRGIVKVYLALFVCFSTKAVHIEVVSNLTADAFLAALRRFIARRGNIANIYSDNGTNFVKANRELKELHELFKSNQSMTQIYNELFLSRQGRHTLVACGKRPLNRSNIILNAL